MMPIEVVQAFQPTDDAEIRNQDQSLVRVTAGSLVTEDGHSPTGDVTAMVTVLDASLEPSVMPGDLRGLDASTGVSEPIVSFGALDVTFVDENGDSLNLRSGQEARVSIPLAEAKDPADAPPTLPLFYWSDETGYWIEEGNASLEQVEPGKWAYVGDVRHFTTWIAALWYETIRITGCVEDGTGNPVASAWVVAIGVDYFGSSVVATDTDGQFDVRVAANSEVVLLAHAGLREGFSKQRTLSTENASIAFYQCFVIPDNNDALVNDLQAELAAAKTAQARAEAERDVAIAAKAAAEAAQKTAEVALAACQAGNNDTLVSDLQTQLAAAKAAQTAAEAAQHTAVAELDAAREAQTYAEAARNELMAQIGDPDNPAPDSLRGQLAACQAERQLSVR